MDEEEMRFFEAYITPGCGATSWTWPRGALGSIGERSTHSAPGPDGIPYEFWAKAPQEVLEFLETAAERMSQGIQPPAQLLDSFTLFIPKGEYVADLERVIRRINELRPITLMQTSANLVAGVVNMEMSDIAKRTVAGEQRGFVGGRTIGDNVIDMEGALYEYSQLCDSMAAIVLLDFAQAFPSLAHRWIRRVLKVMGLNTALLATIEALYTDLVTYVFHNGRKLHSFPIKAGIKQGCPLSGSLFAIAADPLIRAHLANLTIHSGRINLFADDTAIALRHLARSLPSVLALFARWKRASGLALKNSKCVVVPGAENLQAYRDFINGCAEAEGMLVATAATYLGVVVGPTAHCTQWEAVNRKAIKKMQDILVAPSLLGRMVFFNVHIASLYTYKAQFCNPDASAVRHFRRSVQRLTRAPWMAMPCPLLEHLNIFHFPAEVRSLDALVRQAQVGMFARSGVWRAVQDRIEVAAASDDAILNPERRWHRHFVIHTLRQK